MQAQTLTGSCFSFFSGEQGRVVNQADDTQHAHVDTSQRPLAWGDTMQTSHAYTGTDSSI